MALGSTTWRFVVTVIVVVIFLRLSYAVGRSSASTEWDGDE
jgi:hypothetical protein